MDIIGKWRIAFMPKMDEENGVVWVPADVIREEAVKAQDKELLSLLDSLYIFEPDGRLVTAMKLPEGVSQEEIDQAVAEGEIKLYGDDMYSTESQSWKLEDGKVMYDTGITGEVLGEPVSSWVEVEEIDGMIELPFMRLRRVDR